MSSASDRYAVLLRAVNLGRTNRLAMSDLRCILLDAGCTDVQTVLQSGNAVCSSSRTPEALAALVASGLRDVMHKDIGVIVRNAAYIAGVVAANPFSDRSPDGAYVGVTFLTQQPDASVVDAAGPPDGIALGDRAIYAYAPLLVEARFPDWTKLLRQTVTGRNWRTTARILRALEN